MIEFLTNNNLLEYSLKAGSSAVMIIMIFSLMFMLNRSQKKYLESMDKYANLIESNIKTSTELTLIIKSQNENIKDIFNHIRK